MKKNMLMRMFAAALSIFVLAGCGNTTGTVENGSVATEETDADAPDTANEEQNEAEASSTETEADEEEDLRAETEADEEEGLSAETGAQDEEAEKDTEEEAEPETVNWLEEHEITITPQGDCTVNLYSYDSYEEDYVGDYEAGLNVTISETTEGVDEGFKKVVAQFTINISDQPGNGSTWNTCAFDRYTGTYFRGNAKTKEAIWIEDEYYDVRTEREQINDYPMFYITYAVICPADYDGAVFQIGYDSPELKEQNDKLDYQTRLYTMDERPFYGDGYRCFTLTDE